MFTTDSADSFMSHCSVYSENDKNNEETEKELKQKRKGLLYPESDVTLDEFLLAFLAIKQKNSLSDSASRDILKLIKFILPKKNKCPETLSGLNHLFVDKDIGLFHVFCSNCKKIIKNDHIINYKLKKKICNLCQSDASVFLTFDIEKQLNTILIPRIDQIISSNNYNNPNDSEINNAFDGRVYKKYIRDKKDNNMDISFNLNTDGAQVNNSISSTMWPLIGTIVELDQKCRETYNNMVLFGLWLDKTKPDNIFYRKSVEKLKRLMKDKLKLNDHIFNIRIQSFLMDLPAKASVLNIKQFNGEFGCIACDHPGENHHLYKKWHYPYSRKYNYKTDQNYMIYANVAQKTKQHIFGVKGTNEFIDLLDIPSQIPFDYMHLVLQGHTKWLLKQYFFLKKSEYYIGNQIEDINSVIKTLNVPHFINRKFPMIEEKFKLKSSELKIFILYWAIPLLMNILPTKYWYMLCLYVFSVKILYEPIKEKNELYIASDLINSYVKNTENIFGEIDYTLHAHLHLPRQVLDHGPLHVHSQFCFEGSLSNMLKRTSGTVGYLSQISLKTMTDKKLASTFERFEKHPFQNNFLPNYRIIAEEKMTFMHSPYRDYLSLDELNVIQDYFKIFFSISESFLISEKCSLERKVFHSISYKRKGSRDSYSICYRNQIHDKSEEGFGQIVKFIQFKGEIYALLRVYEIDVSYLEELPTTDDLYGIDFDIMKKLFSKYYHSFNQQEYSLKLIQFSQILCHCLVVKADQNSLFTKLAYYFEHD